MAPRNTISNTGVTTYHTWFQSWDFSTAGTTVEAFERRRTSTETSRRHTSVSTVFAGCAPLKACFGENRLRNVSQGVGYLACLNHSGREYQDLLVFILIYKRSLYFCPEWYTVRVRVPRRWKFNYVSSNWWKLITSYLVGDWWKLTTSHVITFTHQYLLIFIPGT